MTFSLLSPRIPSTPFTTVFLLRFLLYCPLSFSLWPSSCFLTANPRFVPILNVDGYEYSWTTDRLWRKNRQPTPVPFCTGIDPDRSWGYMWDAPGSEIFSSNPCSESISHPSPISPIPVLLPVIPPAPPFPTLSHIYSPFRDKILTYFS